MPQSSHFHNDQQDSKHLCAPVPLIPEALTEKHPMASYKGCPRTLVIIQPLILLGTSEEISANVNKEIQTQNSCVK